MYKKWALRRAYKNAALNSEGTMIDPINPNVDTIMEPSSNLTGDGAYRLGPVAKRLLGEIIDNAGGQLGSYVAPKFGLTTGSGRTLGKKAAKKLRKMIGMGAYRTDTNQLIDAISPTRTLSTLNTENEIILSNTEYIQDIVPTSINFQTQLFQAINPGNNSLFPWLSQLAPYFENYQFLQLIFEFRSMVTEGNSNSAGNLIIATQYNPLNGQFTNKQTMENYDYANSCKVTDNCLHGIECDPTKIAGDGQRYIRTGDVPTGQDAKTYDHAVVQVATNGASTNLNIGELWVYYKVKFTQSKFIPPGLLYSPNTLVVQSYSPVTSANWFGATSWTDTNTLISFTTNTMTFPSNITNGTYIIHFSISGAKTGASVFNFGPVPTFSAGKLIDDNTCSAITSGNNLQAVYLFKITGPSCVCTFNTKGDVTGLANIYFKLIQVSNNVSTSYQPH